MKKFRWLEPDSHRRPNVYETFALLSELSSREKLVRGAKTVRAFSYSTGHIRSRVLRRAESDAPLKVWMWRWESNPQTLVYKTSAHIRFELRHTKQENCSGGSRTHDGCINSAVPYQAWLRYKKLMSVPRLEQERKKFFLPRAHSRPAFRSEVRFIVGWPLDGL